MMMPGDMVRLTNHLVPEQQLTRESEKFWIAIPSTAESGQPSLFGSETGLYLGEVRKLVHYGRSKSKHVRKLYHRFFFGGHEVMIDPEFVKVYVSIVEIATFDAEHIEK